jgi:hypothetical protein
MLLWNTLHYKFESEEKENPHQNKKTQHKLYKVMVTAKMSVIEDKEK